jgi:hypothetical protein
MADQTLKQIHLNLLCDRIREGRCVPFLGAGANISNPSRGYKGLSVGSELAKGLADTLNMEPAEQRQVENLDLMELAQLFQLYTDRPYLMETVRKLLDDRNVEPSPLLRTLARLPFNFIVTTNYDRLLERALVEVDRPFEVFTPPSTEKESLDLQDALAGPIELAIFKMHGTFNDSTKSEGRASPIVLTEDDYIDFLSGMGLSERIPALVRSKFVRSTFLLLGYSAKDWDFRIIYRELPEKLKPRVFIVLKEDPPSPWVKYLELQRFVVFNMDIYDFAEQLQDTWDAHEERYNS